MAAMRKSNKDKLEAFAAQTDRYLTENFAGREEEMERVRMRIRDVERRIQVGEMRPAAGATMLIQGAPGAGKTSLIEKLEKDLSPRKELQKKGGLDVARIDEMSLSDPAALEKDLLTVSESSLPAARRLFSAVNGVSVGFAGMSVRVSLDAKSKGAAENESPVDPNRPLVLFIDEIQNTKTEGPSSAFLRRFHEGTSGVPLIPIYAGLAHSSEVLKSCGILRLTDGAVINLGRLSEEEALESTENFFASCDVEADAGLKDRWKAIIWRESQGWPHHLHNALRSLAEVLAKEPRGDLAEVGETYVRRRSAQKRGRYYAAQISGRISRPKILLGQIMARISPAGADKASCVRLINSQHEPGDPATSLPEGMTAGGFFDAMVATGLLQESAEEGVYASPIPSLRNWCIAAAGGRMHSAVLKGDSGVIRSRQKAGANMEARDPLDRTPLHIAAEEDWLEIAGLLLKSGADPEALPGFDPMMKPYEITIVPQEEGESVFSVFVTAVDLKEAAVFVIGQAGSGMKPLLPDGSWRCSYDIGDARDLCESGRLNDADQIAVKDLRTSAVHTRTVAWAKDLAARSGAFRAASPIVCAGWSSRTEVQLLALMHEADSRKSENARRTDWAEPSDDRGPG